VPRPGCAEPRIAAFSIDVAIAWPRQARRAIEVEVKALPLTSAGAGQILETKGPPDTAGRRVGLGDLAAASLIGTR